MKYSFNLLQTCNWLYMVRTKLKKMREQLDEEEIPISEAIKMLEQQRSQLLTVKEVLSRRVSLLGIQRDFLINLQQIKKDYGIED